MDIFRMQYTFPQPQKEEQNVQFRRLQNFLRRPCKPPSLNHNYVVLVDQICCNK